MGKNQPIPASIFFFFKSLSVVFLKSFVFIYFWLCGVLLPLGLFSSGSEWGLLFVAVCGVLIMVTSLVVNTDSMACSLQ